MISASVADWMDMTLLGHASPQMNGMPMLEWSSTQKKLGRFECIRTWEPALISCAIWLRPNSVFASTVLTNRRMSWSGPELSSQYEP
ncbi:hypothetical protein [Rhodococcus erythropolis]|uniref:hypothetical protein n=1 Tax=Rhodococcus erythropolis TaxID=1833 RepID=UPI00083FA135|nr:hypothetical protein [Rhodococcus erythropolis]